MLAARWWGREDVRVEQIPDPGSPTGDWVRLRVEACGICGTDLEEYTSGPNVVPTEPHALTGRCAPLTLGHESVGIVDEPGPDSPLRKGTRVAIEGNLFCGECWWCKRHEYHLCIKLACLGLMTDGGLAEYVLAPSFMCIPYSEETRADHAAVSEPLSVAVRAVRKAKVELGSSVAILGAGTIGLLTAQMARLQGAKTVIVVEKNEHRRALALQLGADAAVSPEDANEAAYDMTDSIGPDITIEAAGVPAVATAAVRLARKGGRTILLGVYPGMAPIDMMDLLLGEKQVAAALSHIYDEDYVTAVKLIEAGKVQIDPIITDHIKLEDIVEEGFKALLADPSAHLKVIVSP